MEYTVEAQRHESFALAVVRRRARQDQLSAIVPEACGTVWTVLKAQGVRSAGRNVALYHDGEINLEAGVEMSSAFTSTGEVFASHTPAGNVATAVHRGPYDRLREAHAAIRHWCASHGYALAGPNWEIYDHWSDDWNGNPALIRTDVVYLLKPEAPPPA